MDKPIRITYTCDDCKVSRIMMLENRLQVRPYAQCQVCKKWIRFTKIIDLEEQAKFKEIFGDRWKKNEESGIQGVEPK